MLGRLLLTIVALTMIVSACGADGTAEPIVTSEPIATTAGTTTEATQPVPPERMVTEFLQAAAEGDVQSALGAVIPEQVGYWSEDRLTNLIEFFGAIADGPPFTVDNCMVVDTIDIADDTGQRVSCDVTLAMMSEDASAVLGLPLVEVASGVALEGMLARPEPPTFEAIMDSVTFHGLSADPAGHEAACQLGPGMEKHNQVVFNATCGSWLAGFFEDLEAFLLAQQIEDAEDQYAVSCARCHGADLDGGLGGPTLLDESAENISDESKKQYISLGGTLGMPAFKLLSEEQIDALIAYIRDVEGRTT